MTKRRFVRIALSALTAIGTAGIGGCLSQRCAKPACRPAQHCTECETTSHGSLTLDEVLQTPPAIPPQTVVSNASPRPTMSPNETVEPVADQIHETAVAESAPNRSTASTAPVDVDPLSNHPSALDPPAASLPPRTQPSADYRIRPGDRLDILFNEYWKPGADYRLLPGDEVRVEFLVRPESSSQAATGLDRTVRIQPDGKIAMPFLGVVEAAGRTLPELAELLTGRYARLYVDPHLHVTLVSTGRMLADLRESMRAIGGRAAVVAPDGTIGLPHLGMVTVAGLNLAEIEDEINERYSRVVPGFTTTVRLASP